MSVSEQEIDLVKASAKFKQSDFCHFLEGGGQLVQIINPEGPSSPLDFQ